MLSPSAKWQLARWQKLTCVSLILGSIYRHVPIVATIIKKIQHQRARCEKGKKEEVVSFTCFLRKRQLATVAAS